MQQVFPSHSKSTDCASGTRQTLLAAWARCLHGAIFSYLLGSISLAYACLRAWTFDRWLARDLYGPLELFG